MAHAVLLQTDQPLTTLCADALKQNVTGFSSTGGTSMETV